MTHPTNDDASAIDPCQSETDELKPASSTTANALDDANRALREALEELRETRDRLCREADEFERRVRERTAELEAIIGSLPDAVYIGDANGISRCNERGLETLGFASVTELRTAIPILNATLQNRYADTGERIPPEDEAFARALQGEPRTYEVISRNVRTGEDVIQRCAANPILLDGQVIGAVAINTDITDQKRTEQALREAVAQLSQREAVLLDTTEKLQQARDELEARVAQRTAELAAREASLAASQVQLRSLTHRLVQVQEDERRALARDLHDTSGQAMTVINLGLAMLRREAGGREPGGRESGSSEKTLSRIDDLRRVADGVAEDLRRLSVNLRPSTLDRYGLVPALDDLLQSTREREGIEIDFQVEGLEERLPDDTETALYRIVQEATTNITRYASASQASVALRQAAGRIHLRIEDNGRGFDIDEALSRGRLGLLGMRERAEMLDGTFTIESRPGQGARLQVDVPLEAAHPDLASHPDLTGFDPERSSGNLSGLVPPPRLDPNPRASDPAELARAKALSDELVEIAAGMVRNTTASEMLEFVVARAAEAVGCEVATIMSREGDGWFVSHGYHAPPGLVGRRLSDEEAPTTAQVARTQEMVVVNDLGKVSPEANQAAAGFALSSFACVPLLTGSRLLGSMNFSYHANPGVFAPSEVDFLKRLASLVSLALENTRLHEAEAQQRQVLEAVFATAPIGLAVLAGDEHEYKLANTAFRLTTPHPEVDPVGRRYSDIWPPEEGFDKGPAWLHNVLHDGHSVDVEQHQRVFPDGSEHYFAFHVRPLSWNGEPAALVVLSDVTQSEESAAAARRSAAERDAILSSISDGLVVYDMNGKIVRMNLTAERILAYSQPEAGASFAERARQMRPRKLDGQFYALEELPASRARAGEIVQGAVMALDRVGGPAWVSASAAPILGPDGQQQGVVATFTDIAPLRAAQYELEAANARLDTAYRELQAHHAEQAEAQRALRRSEAIYRAIARSFPRGAMYVFDHDLRYQVVEGEALSIFGQTREAMEGKTIWETMHPGTLAVIEPRYRRALAGESMHFETRHSEVYQNRVISADYRPIRNADGEIIAGLLVAEDVSEREQMLADLHNNIAELNGVLSAIPSGLIVYDREGHILRINDLAREMLGYDDETWERPVAERVTDVVLLYRPDGTALLRDEYPAMRALLGQEARNEDLFLHLPAHPEKDFWAVLDACPIEDRAGKPLGAVLTMTDVSALHQARTHVEVANERLQQQASELRDAAERLEQRVLERTAALGRANQALVEQARLLDLAHDAIFVRKLDATISYWNQGAADMYGWSREEAEGRVSHELLHTVFPRPIHEIEARVLKTGRWDGELVHTRRDGGQVLVSSRWALQRDRSGHPTGMLEINTDITGQKQAQERIAYQARVLDNVNDAIFASDAQLRITYWNRVAETQYGIKDEEAIGAYAPDVLGSRMDPEVQKAILSKIDETDGWRGEVTHTRPDGSPMYVEMTLMGLHDEMGQVSGFVSVNRDVTERKRSEQALAAALRSLEESQSELRTLSRRLVEIQESERTHVADQLYNQAAQVLTAVRMQLWAVEHRGEPPSEEALTDIKTALDQTILALHDLASELRPAGLDRATLAAVLHEYVSRFVRAQGLSFTFDAGGTEKLRLAPAVVTAIYRTVQEALANVLHHARARQVSLSFSRTAKMCIVTLSDDGAGFDVTRAQANGGVGLISMRERIESVGGRLTVRSDPAGTTVTIEAPLELDL